MADQSEQNEEVEALWHSWLTTGTIPGFRDHYPVSYLHLRRFFELLPRDPRCHICDTPFEGIGGKVVQLVWGRERSELNPLMCNVCETQLKDVLGGAEVELSLLFADVRGSTTLAEGMSPGEFSQIIDRFYRTATDVLIHADALIEKLVGDQVTALFVPGIAGPDHARRAIKAAREILRATGHDKSGDPWLPVGAGIHTGTAWVGAVGTPGGLVEITALGDAVNTAARLSSEAATGEILVSEDAVSAARLDTTGLEERELQLKGRSEAVRVRVARIDQ